LHPDPTTARDGAVHAGALKGTSAILMRWSCPASIMLTMVDRQHNIDDMKIEQHTYGRDVETLLDDVRDLLDSANARDRVRAVHILATGIKSMEHRVLFDAQASGMSWTEIGDVYGVSRQAVHRRFADETMVPSDYFDALLQELDEPPEVVPALARAAKRAQSDVAAP